MLLLSCTEILYFLLFIPFTLLNSNIFCLKKCFYHNFYSSLSGNAIYIMNESLDMIQLGEAKVFI